MLRLVEDAGKPVFAAWLSQLHALTGWKRGTRWIGGRRARWFLSGESVIFWHPPADPAGKCIYYPVDLDYTDLPSGGSRWWWLCPGCGKRVDVLYLPGDRDRLACRTCCGLRYRSQYTRGKARRRNYRPLVMGDNLIGPWIWLAPWRRR